MCNTNPAWTEFRTSKGVSCDDRMKKSPLSRTVRNCNACPEHVSAEMAHLEHVSSCYFHFFSLVEVTKAVDCRKSCCQNCKSLKRRLWTVHSSHRVQVCIASKRSCGCCRLAFVDVLCWEVKAWFSVTAAPSHFFGF